MTPTLLKPSDVSPRSGDQVRGTVLTSGMLTTLLSPFIHMFVAWLEQATGQQLGLIYETQLLAAVITGAIWASAAVRMRMIHNQTAVDVQSGTDVPGVVTVKEVVKEVPHELETKEPKP